MTEPEIEFFDLPANVRDELRQQEEAKKLDAKAWERVVDIALVVLAALVLLAVVVGYLLGAM